eukprot:gene8082-2813_t
MSEWEVAGDVPPEECDHPEWAHRHDEHSGAISCDNCGRVIQENRLEEVQEFMKEGGRTFVHGSGSARHRSGRNASQYGRVVRREAVTEAENEIEKIAKEMDFNVDQTQAIIEGASNRTSMANSRHVNQLKLSEAALELKRGAIIKNTDMIEADQDEAISCAAHGLGTLGLTKEEELAHYIKREFDEAKEGTWHAVVGSAFGAWVTHEAKNFIYFYLSD